ncbi:glycosyltransferase [Pedobacter sp. PWIIR3]
METGISVLVCTYNGSKRLPKTLEYLSKQKVENGIRWEVILIDNASTDNTAEIAEIEWNKYEVKAVNLTLLKQNNPGKINALQLGLSKAKFEFFVICDDDNWLEEDYIQNVYDILKNDPDIGAVGGQSIAVTYSGELPNWFEDHQAGYAVGHQGRSSGDVTERGHLWGAGMGTRTQLYKEIYRNVPSLLIGRSGKKLTAGEDSEYCQRLILKGYKLYYDSRLKFTHYMPANRLTVEYRTKLFEGLQESNQVLDKYALAIKTRLKYNKNIFSKFRLILATKLRILIAGSSKEKQKQRDVLVFAFSPTKNPDPISLKIQEFIKS